MTDTAWGSLELSPEHLGMLQDSGITPDVAADRGYRTVATPFEVPDLFGKAQRKRVPALLVPIYGVDGGDEPVSYQLRPDEPRVDGRSGKTVKYESPAKKPQVLDIPPRARPSLADPDTPLWVTEGAKKADSAVSIGLCCLSLAGVWNFRATNPDGGKVELPDWEKVALNGRTVYICFDSDVVTKQPVRRAMSRLAGILSRRGATAKVVVPSAGPNGSKRGLDDLIAAGAREADLVALVDDGFLTDERGLDVKLRDWVLDHYTLGQDTDGNGYAVPRSGPRIVRMLTMGRPSLELEAPARFSADDPANPVVPRRVVKDVLSHVAGVCADAPTRQLYLRSAQHRNGIVIDLGDSTGQVVAVSPQGWKVVDTPPADFPLFRRTENVRPLPTPEPGGSLDELRELLNVADDTWPLIQGWLIGSLFGWIPRPWLFHTGPQGSGKSDGGLLVLSVIDPRNALSEAPRKGDRSDPGAQAASSYLIGWDNLSRIPAELSDWLCALVTGAEDHRRVLHTTATMQILSFMRSGVLTGISVPMRPDLAERVIPVEFSRITESARRSRGEVMDRFADTHPRILGALLDAVSIVLTHWGDVELSAAGMPRMADYARILAAHDRGAATELLEAYREACRAGLSDVADEDPVATVISSYVAEHGSVEMEPGDLYQSLSVHRTAMDLPEDAYWPKRAEGLTTALKALTVAIADRVTLTFKRVQGRRRVVLEPAEQGDANPGQGDAENQWRHPGASPTDSQVNNPSTPQGDAGDANFRKLPMEETSIHEGQESKCDVSPHVKDARRHPRHRRHPEPTTGQTTPTSDDELPNYFKVRLRPEDPIWRPSQPVADEEAET